MSNRNSLPWLGLLDLPLSSIESDQQGSDLPTMAAAVEPHTMPTSLTNAVAGPSRGQTIQAAFEVYREEIDAHNDRRERLIKASRDVTGLSKKLIFLLHRFPTPAHLSSSSQGQAPPPQPQRSKLHQEAQTKIDDIVAVINRVAFEEHLSRGSRESERYERNFGSGVEEFVSIQRPISTRGKGRVC